MIGKLRKKLILAAMVSLILVLMVIIGGIAFVNYSKIISDADSTLSLLAQNDGFFPDAINSPPPKGIKINITHNIPPELPFETRYFFVRLNSDGIIKAVNTGKIAAIDTQTAIEYAKTVWESDNQHGFLENYRYFKTDVNNNSLIIFLDCRRNLDSFQTLIISSIMVSAGGAMLVFILLVFFSKHIVKPFSESYEKQKQFITNAGHELKTPLTIIDADTEILTMDIGENEWITEIRNQTKRLADLTNDLIFLSRMEENRSVQMQLFNLSELISSTIQSFEGVAKAQQKEIISNIDKDIKIYAEQKSIQKLITILIDNAIKYMPNDNNVKCELLYDKHNIRFSISNPCEYITNEQTERLFDRFYRTDNSRNSESGGYGLGLSIAQVIVLSHKGKITAYTNDNHSLTITVTFPQTKI